METNLAYPVPLMTTKCSFRRPSGARPNSRWCAVVALFLLAGCATQSNPAAHTAFPGSIAEQSFAKIYRNVSDRYLEEIPVESLAVHGFEGLTALDADIRVEHHPDAVVITRAGIQMARYLPPTGDDINGWANLTVQVLADARTYSPVIKESRKDKIYEAVIDGTLSVLDSFSRYAGPEKAAANKARRSGFFGVGIQYRPHAEGIDVVRVIAGGPAARSGILKGDIITHVDETPITGLDRKALRTLLRGAAGTRVTLRLQNPETGRQADVAVKRARILRPTVAHKIKDGIIYLAVTGFNRRTARSVETNLRAARRQLGRQAKGIVIDLRGNPGGLLKQAVRVADVFLSEGRIVATRGRHPDSSRHFDAHDGDLVSGLPIVVLVNGRSASAAEIVAAALQDHNRAVVVGTGSFGKGTVQSVMPLPNDGEITLTWSRFLTPSGYVLHGLGVLPSVCTSGEVGEAKDGAAVTLVEKALINEDKSTLTAEAWRHVAHNDAAERRHLRDNCPAQNIKNPIDSEVAELLINDQRLYQKLRSQASNALLSAR
ncbi:MAG: S41 family peptidase [Proteobacteria bacterium]|nr:S41 family peptidase [Pseudomonadota bacterium]